jgi:hypothetical protein
MATTATTADKTITTKRRFFRPRFTLAALLVLISIIAIPLGYVAQRRGWNLRRKAAYELLASKGLYLDIVAFRTGGGNPTRPPTSVFQQYWRRLMLDDETEPAVGAIVEIGRYSATQPNPLSDKDLELLSLFPELENLELHGEAGTPQITGAFFEKLRVAPALVWLRIEGLDRFEGQHLRSLKYFPKLSSLIISDCPKINDETLKNVELPASIKSLWCEKCSFGDDTLSRWLATASLTELCLDQNVTKQIAPALAKQKNLISLSIQNAPLNDEDLRCLSSLESLECLELTGMPLNGSFLMQLKVVNTLELLDLSGTALEDQFVAEIARFKNLRLVNLAWTNIDGTGFEGDIDWPAANGFYFTGAEFSPQGKSAVARMHGPKEIGLPWNWTGDDSVQYFKDSPSHKTSISSLPLDQQFKRTPIVSRGWRGNPFRFRACDRAPIEKMSAVIALQDKRRAEIESLPGQVMKRVFERKENGEP